MMLISDWPIGLFPIRILDTPHLVDKNTSISSLKYLRIVTGLDAVNEIDVPTMNAFLFPPESA